MSKPLVPARASGRAATAQRAASAQRARIAAGDGACTDRALAQRLGMTHPHVAELFDPDGGKALALGDLAALPRALAEDILVAELAALTSDRADVATRDTFDGVAIVLGEALSGLRSDLAKDGREDEHERHAAALRRMALICLRGADACQRRAGGSR